MAHKKGQGSSRNGRDSKPKFRGVKISAGEPVRAGGIIVRQCGTKWKAGYLVHRCKDDTLMALQAGAIRFRGKNIDIIPVDPATPHFTAVC